VSLFSADTITLLPEVVWKLSGVSIVTVPLLLLLIAAKRY